MESIRNMLLSQRVEICRSLSELSWAQATNRPYSRDEALKLETQKARVDQMLAKERTND